MGDRRPKLLFDAITAIQAAQGFVAGQDLASYRADLMRRSAVERQLEILGEAASRLAREDASIVDRMPALRLGPEAQAFARHKQSTGLFVSGLSLAVGMRNRIIHGYDGVDDETVFHTVLESLPTMLISLQGMLAALTSDAADGSKADGGHGPDT